MNSRRLMTGSPSVSRQDDWLISTTIDWVGDIAQQSHFRYLENAIFATSDIDVVAYLSER